MKPIVVIFILLNFSFVWAQVPTWDNPNFRKKKLFVGDSIQLDSLFILNDKIELKDKFGNLIPNDNYSIDFERSLLRLEKPISDTIEISYYVHPALKRIDLYPKDPGLIVASANESQALVLDNRTQERRDMFEGLETQGSMVRGISFGNNQGSAVQSSLDLRLNGKLSEKLGITAMISDTNVPIEADGYTQSLEQFDRVFVELFTNNSSARAGHIDLEQKDEYFGAFNRRVSGLQLKHRVVGDSAVTHMDAAGSISRGEFKNMTFTGQEGNQGPYRLTGNHNEAYVIILSGSERIYKNGLLLQRGENYDYVMNYNTGEITFTPKHMIRSTDRFIAEYQYTNRYYNRFSLYGGAKHIRKKFKISTHFFSEMDNKNSSVNQNLRPEDKAVLADAGNDSEQMFVSAAEQVPYEEGKVLYRKIMMNGVEVFEYSTNPNDMLYEVGFTFMGQNKGNYELSDTAVNGRIFEYVIPIAGVPQGQYEPIRLLVAPQQKQVWSLSTSYDLNQNGQITLDAGLSNVDKNLFSDLDDEDNVGLGLRIGAKKAFWLRQIKILPDLNYEYVQHKFSPIEILRNPEFAREFNLENELGKGDQHFLQSNITAYYSDSLKLKYGFDYLNEKENYNGNRHRAEIVYLTEKTEVLASYKLLNSSTQAEKTTFSQYDAIAKRRTGALQVGAGIVGESNMRKIDVGQDSLSLRWNEVFALAQLGDTLGQYASMRLYRRTDDSTKLARLQRYSTALGAVMESALLKNKHHTLGIMVHYRDVDYADSTHHVSFLNAAVNWQKSFWNQAIDLNMKYEISGGTELQRAFTYAEVAEGLGIYKWTDYNEDGVQQLDEFEVAEFSDQANFVRVYTSTVSALRTNHNGLNVSMRLNPSRYFGNDTFWRRIQSNVMYTHQGSFLKNGKIAIWNPWETSEAIRNKTTHFYWQTKYNAGQQYKWNFTHELSLQEHTRFVFTGLESLNTQINTFNIQYKWKSWLMAELKNRYEKVESASQAFESRRYNIKGYDVIPKLYFTWSEQLSSSLAYTLQDFENQMGIESLQAHQLNFDLRWDGGEKTSLLAGMDWIKNDFVGNPNSVVGNRMMEGLKNGNNLVWQLMLERNINRYLVLNVQYSGRKNERLKAIHTGNVQLRLNF